jgi:hypothetical protein
VNESSNSKLEQPETTADDHDLCTISVCREIESPVTTLFEFNDPRSWFWGITFAIKMSESQPWFTVRCLFSHPGRVKDGDGNLYEERVTLWKCGSWDEAFRLARLEAETYAREGGAVLIDTTDAFHQFDTVCGHGTEVWSVMRGSHLNPQTYASTFCTTERDRSQDYTGPE